MHARTIASKLADIRYELIIFIWSILLAPISLAVFIFTSPHAHPMALAGIGVMWVAVIGGMTDEDSGRRDWKKRFEQWVLWPLIATFIQALIFRSSLWHSFLFLNTWWMVSRGLAGFVLPVRESYEQKNWKEFKSRLLTFFGGAPIMILLFIPVIGPVVFSILESSAFLANGNESLQKALVAATIIGLLLDVTVHSKPKSYSK